MDLQLRKLELIEMLLKTEEISVLEKIKALLMDNSQGVLTREVDYKLMDKRRQSHLNEESASYTWEEVKEKVRNANL